MSILTGMKAAAILLFPISLFAALPTPVVPAKVVDAFTPAPFAAQRIDGLLAERMRINLQERLLHLDEVGVIEGFQRKPGKQDWIGEHAGKFLDAAANTWEYTHDTSLKTLMDRVAHELIAPNLPMATSALTKMTSAGPVGMYGFISMTSSDY